MKRINKVKIEYYSNIIVRAKHGDGVYKVNWKGMYEFCGATFIFEEGEDR